MAWTHTRRSDDSVDKQALQWTPKGHRGIGDRPRNTWRRDLEKEMWNSGTAGGRRRRQLMTEWSVAYDPRGITMTKSGC